VGGSRDLVWDVALPAAAVALLLGAWQLIAVALDVPKWLLPSPVSILKAFWAWKATLGWHFVVTLYETVAGFALAVAVGVPLAVGMIYSRILHSALYPILAAVQSVPRSAIAPLLLVWFGAGELPKVIIVFLISFFPIVINTLTGMRQVEPDLLDLTASLCATKGQTVWQVRFPNAIPYAFSAFKMSITLSVVGAVIGEFVGADRGLGYMILIAASQLKTDVAFVCIGLLAFMGMGLFACVELVERLFLPWYTPEEREAHAQA
jgi:NitT/TauT family transport system permease protein